MNYAQPVCAGIYTNLIEEILDTQKRGSVDASEIEAWMREKFHTLDALTRSAFAREVRIALKNFDRHGSTAAL